MKWMAAFVLICGGLGFYFFQGKSEVASSDAIELENQNLIKDKNLHAAFKKILDKKEPQRTVAAVPVEDPNAQAILPKAEEIPLDQDPKTLTDDQKEQIYTALSIQIKNDEFIVNTMRAAGENESVLELEQKIEANKKRLEDLNYEEKDKEIKEIGANDEKGE